MAKTDLLKRYLDAGVAFTEVSQQKAEEIVRDLVRAGKVPADQAQQRVADLLDRSRQNSDAVVQLVRKEVRSQLAKLGMLPKQTTRSTPPSKPGPSAGAAPASGVPAKKASPPVRTAVTKTAAPAKKAATKVAPSKPAAPAKATAKKVAKKAPTRPTP